MSVAGNNNYSLAILPKGFISGLELAFVSTTSITLKSGLCRDSSDEQNISLASDVTINFSTVGANGIDSGAIGASKTYYVFAIGNSLNNNASAGLVSLSATPTLPLGYDMFRQVGFVKSDASSHVIKFFHYGKGNDRKHYYDDPISVLTTGAAVSDTAIDLSAAVPSVDKLPVQMRVDFTPAAGAGGARVIFSQLNGTGDMVEVSGAVASVVQYAQVELVSLLSTTAKINYLNTAAACSVNAAVSCYSYSV
jgi:hypothetical protein